jgi:hypothetical protein
MQYDIRQLAGSAEPAALGQLIEEMAPKIAPHVSAVTALPLPERLTIRIVTVPEWMRLWAREDERLLAAEVEALSPPREEIEHARAVLLARREAHSRMAVGAQTVRYGQEESSLVVLADNLLLSQFRDGAWSVDYVRRMLAHELAHVGQYTAGGEQYRRLTSTPFLAQRQFANRGWSFAAEGYAVWAAGLVTARTGSAATAPDRPAHEAVPSSGWSTAQARRMDEWYADAGRAVSEVIALCGLRTVNRIWTHHDLLPTAAEERDHVAWQRRLLGAPPGGRGQFAAGAVPGGTQTFVVTMPDRP